MSSEIMLALSGMIGMAAITYAFRFAFRWISPKKTTIKDGNLYLVMGKPTNIYQLGIAVYSGVAGSFGITDGKNTWYCSRPAGKLIKEPLEQSYLLGKNVEEIGTVDKNKLIRLKSIEGTKFSYFNNCMQFKQIARDWKNERGSFAGRA